MKYLKWKGGSSAGFFEYYDGTQNVRYDNKVFTISYPITYRVKGWDEASNEEIFSNAIEKFDEPFTVRTKSKKLFEGKYAKKDVEALKAKLHIIVTGIDESGDEVQIALKGMNYFNLSKVLKDRPVSIELVRVDDTKNG